MQGLSKNEIKVISWLEFNRKYFFEIKEISHFFRNKAQRYNFIKNLAKKKRIVKLNRTKYYLVPIKAKSGSWAEHPYLIIDEMFNGQNYVIGGWSAANYWHLTEQVPMVEEVYTTKRRGQTRILTTSIKFTHTTDKKIKEKSAVQKIQEHPFRVLSKEASRKWLRSRK